jgi:hypothetical protein
MRIKNTPSWIQIGASGYWLPRKHTDYNYYYTITGEELNYLLGSGLDLNYKYFFNKKESWYLAGGCSYTRYNIEYIDRYWHSYTDKYGLVYMTNEHGSLKHGINKFGINTYIGYQIPKPTFLFDMFVGLGYKYSIRDNNKGKPFDDGMLSFGYKGVVFITGVRFGVKFKQQ